MKIKLRDMTENEYFEWRSINCYNNLSTCKDCYFENTNCGADSQCWVYHKDMFSDKFLDQEIEIERRDEVVLIAQERDYLRNVIRPFRDRVEHIKKEIFYGGECITISIRDNVSSKRLYPYNDCTLPIFEKGKYYKGMELFREYTLEELRL